MPRGRGKGRGDTAQQQPNIETHEYNELIIPQLRVAQWELDFLRDNMPAPELLNMPIHGWTHILHMLVYASAFCRYGAINLDVVRWAILIHDSGRYHDNLQESLHGLMSRRVARKMSAKLDSKQSRYGADDRVFEIVARHSLNDQPYCNEEGIVRACERLDLWRTKDFPGIKPKLVTAPGWLKVEKIARKLRVEGRMPDE